MESAFLTCILVSSLAVRSSHAHLTEWDDIVVARLGSSATLVCTDETARGLVSLNWMVMSPGAEEWKLLLSASEKKEFSGGASKASMRLADPNYQESGVFTLHFFPTVEDRGLYSCSIRKQGRKQKEKTILLAILTVTVLPSPIIPMFSTLRLIAKVTDNAMTTITWTSPDGVAMKSEMTVSVGTEAKLPLIQHTEGGSYNCTVQAKGNSNSSTFVFGVNVSVDADNVLSLTDKRDDTKTSTAALVHTPLLLNCPSSQGDFVRLQWQPADSNKNLQAVIQYDRWRDYTSLTKLSKRVQLAGAPYNAEAGSFAFLFTPKFNEGGLYVCEMFLNDKPSFHSTVVSMMKVVTKRLPSKLELNCLYTGWSQVWSVTWHQQNANRQLQQSAELGSISTTVPLPATPETAGNYTCTLRLKNGRTIWATQAVELPAEGGRDEHGGGGDTDILPSLSALLLLVPLVAAAVGVLLWRRKQISDRDIEFSLSVQSGEVENIYENPDDLRQQGPPQGSLYMDLKPRGEDDVYKELEQYEQCQS